MVLTATQKKKAEEAARSEQAKKNAKLKPREFEETTIQGDDGGREINHRKTNMEFKNLGDQNVKIDLANCGLEHCIQDPNDLAEDEKPYGSMLDVVRNYLTRSFTGTIGSGVVKSHPRDVLPFVLWTALTKAYEQEDEYTSKAELEYVYDQFPHLAQLLMRKAAPHDRTSVLTHCLLVESSTEIKATCKTTCIKCVARKSTRASVSGLPLPA